MPTIKTLDSLDDGKPEPFKHQFMMALERFNLFYSYIDWAKQPNHTLEETNFLRDTVFCDTKSQGFKNAMAALNQNDQQVAAIIKAAYTL